MRIIYSILLLMAALAAPVPCLAAKVLAVTEEQPPFNFMRGGEVTGASTEVVRKVCERAGVECDIRLYPWSRAYEMAQRDENVLIFSIARIPSREGLFQWAGVLAPWTVKLYRQRGNDKIRVRNLDDLRRYRVVAVKNDARGVFLEESVPGLAIGWDYSDGSNLRKVALGRADLTPLCCAGLPIMAHGMGLDPEHFEGVMTLDGLSENLHMAFSKQTDPTLVDRFREALQELYEEGEVERIHKAYGLPCRD